MALTDKQMNFINEYMQDMNATAAYLRAGYNCSEEAARRAASRLLTNVDVKAEIEKRQQKLGEESEITVEWILKEMKDTYKKSKELGEMSAANKSLEMLGRYKGMFNDKLKLDGSVTIKKLEEFFS